MQFKLRHRLLRQQPPEFHQSHVFFPCFHLLQELHNHGDAFLHFSDSAFYSFDGEGSDIGGGAAGFDVCVGAGEQKQGFGGTAGGEAGDCGGRRIQVRKEFGAGEAEEEVLVGGGQVSHSGGTHGVGAEAVEFWFGEGAVEGDETGHGGGGLEGQDSDGGGEEFVVLVIAEPRIGVLRDDHCVRWYIGGGRSRKEEELVYI